MFYTSGLLEEESLLKIISRINRFCKSDLMVLVGMLMISEGVLGF